MPARPARAESVLDLIGETPLVTLRRVGRGIPTPLLAKLEFLNPGGSVKDRIAPLMIDEAERQGWLKPGGTIVEATSGNTGVGLAMVAAVRGYRAVFVIPDKMSSEKIRLLRAFGARVVITPTQLPPEHPMSYYSVARRLSKEIPGAYFPNQYVNPMNPEAHFRTTGPEIARDAGDSLGAVVLTVGTGGTISGVGRYIHQARPGVRVIGVDPKGSILHHYAATHERIRATPYKVEGIGEDMIPETVDFGEIDEFVEVDDRESFSMARRLAREEGLFVGGSSGSAVAGALKWLRANPLPDGKSVVVLLPDSGDRYLSKFYSDEWMRENRFLDEGATVGGLLTSKVSAPALVAVEPTASVRAALDLLSHHNVSQLPVLQGGQNLGSLAEEELLRAALADQTVLDRAVTQFLGPPFHEVPFDMPIADVLGQLKETRALLVRDASGKEFRGLVTRHDVVAFLLEEGVALRFDTRVIHDASPPDAATGAVSPPIYLTSTFAQIAPNRNKGWVYSRSANPTRAQLEAVLARLEGGATGLAFSSGLGALTTLLDAFPAGAKVLAGTELYGGSYRMFQHRAKQGGLRTQYVDMADLEAVRTAVEGSAPDLVFFETPTNPLLRLADLSAIAKIAHSAGARVVVDNTFASPALQRPMEHGADVVLHSTTKYLGGHSDIIGGALIAAKKGPGEELAWLQNALGAVPSPVDCFLVLRGIRTLGLRMRRHSENGRAVAESLATSPKVLRVHYPGLRDHPQRSIARRQMHGFGGMVSVELRGGEGAARKFLGAMRLFTLAESLGGVESLAEHPASMTHSSMPRKVREAGGIGGGLVRMSCGIEASDDLVADVRSALRKV